MSEAAFRSRIGALATGAGALAAIGAALRLRRDGAEAPADVQQRLDEVLAALDLPPLEALDAAQAARLSAVVSLVLRHALELLDNPARPAGWNHTDTALIEAQGASAPDDVVPRLAAAGFEAVEIAPAGLLAFVLGQRR